MLLTTFFVVSSLNGWGDSGKFPLSDKLSPNTIRFEKADAQLANISPANMMIMYRIFFHFMDLEYQARDAIANHVVIHLLKSLFWCLRKILAIIRP